MSYNTKNIIENLKKYIDTNQLSRDSVARALSITTPTLSRWLTEKLKPNVQQVQAISDLTGLSISELFSDAPFIYKEHEVFEVGINNLCTQIHDFRSFLFFIDAYKAIASTNEASSCWLLVDTTIQDPKSHDLAILILDFEMEDFNSVTLTTVDDNEEFIPYTISEDDVLCVGCDQIFNNSSFSVNLLLQDQTTLQIIFEC